MGQAKRKTDSLDKINVFHSEPDVEDRCELSAILKAEAERRYEYLLLDLAQLDPDTEQNETNMSLLINEQADAGWEVVQVYAAMQPRKALMGTSFVTIITAVLRREKCPQKRSSQKVATSPGQS